MLKRALLAVPALAGLALVVTRVMPGPQPDGTTVLPSGWRIRPAGRPVADTSAKLFAAGLAVDPARGLVAIIGNLSDSVYLIDAATLTRRGAVAVGHRPYTLVADSTHLYVSDWGDSTVSVIDLSASPPVRRSVFVGPHPSALALRGRDLFVALAGANGVARIDLTRGAVVEQLTVALDPHAPLGSDPNALALAPDGKTLYVAMAGNNAVAVVRLDARRMRVAGLIPVGWYPTALAVSPDGRTLYVANGKGNGSGANRDGKYIGNVITGSVSIVPVPDGVTLARYTRAVYALSPYSNARLRGLTPDRLTARPPVRHVVYIIRENRTYDQVFGDMPQGNGDPSLAIFNDSVTPNAHAIARRWVLFDNFYVDGEVSADGHEWSDRAFAGDYNEKTWPQIYSDRRTWDLTSGEDLANPRDATLGRVASRPTPRAMVADNDLALGRIVERLTRSAAWPSLALFVLEDDAQNGSDHVDAHRSVLLLASPSARSGVVDSTLYTTSSVLRSIELILGLAPLSQYDAAATPLWNAFSRRLDSTAFSALPNTWPLDQLNPRAFRSRIPSRDLAAADAADEALLNWEIWTSVRPGERLPISRHAGLLAAPAIDR